MSSGARPRMAARTFTPTIARPLMISQVRSSQLSPVLRLSPVSGRRLCSLPKCMLFTPLAHAIGARQRYT